MRLRYLDGLRGLAALIVIFDHFWTAFFPAAIYGYVTVFHDGYEQTINKTPLALFFSGDFSVAIFFVLSGIVLSTKYFRTKDPRFVVASAAKRYFRLAIPVLSCVMIVFLLMSLHVMYNQQAAELTGSAWLNMFWQFPPNFFTALYQGAAQVFTFSVPSQTSYNPVLWTMKNEFIGSFMVFLTLLVFGRMKRRYIIYAALVILFWNTHYTAFILGMAISDLYINGHESVTHWLQKIWVWLPVSGIGLVFGLASLDLLTPLPVNKLQQYIPPNGDVGDLASLFHIAGAVLLVGAVMYAKPLQAILNTRIAQFLGRISFASYLLHFIILGSFSSFLFTQLASQMGYRSAFVITFGASLILIVATSYLFAKYVDEWAVRTSGILYKRIFTNSAPLLPRHVPTPMLPVTPDTPSKPEPQAGVLISL